MSCEDTNLEESLIGFPDIVTLKKTETIVEQIKNCIFRIHINDGGNGTGFFCLIHDENKQKNMRVMITCNHIIGDDYLNNNKNIKISLNNKKKIIDIKLDSSRKKYTSKTYDVTIIEIKKEDNINDNSFLKIDEQIYQDDPHDFFTKKTAYIIQYPKYLDASVSYGLIHRINENSDLEHFCITYEGSSGSPIINLENHEVIGVHKAGSNKKFNYNKGTFLNNPIKEFFSNAENIISLINQNDLLKDKYIKKTSITQIKIDAMKRLQEEYKDLSIHPLINFGISVGLCDENNLFEWRGTILGPIDTCYKGGVFFLKIIFPDNYPNSKPEIVFETPVYHLNVKFFVGGHQPLDHICLSTLNNWKKEYKMNKVLPEIFDLLSRNNPDSPYDYADFRRRNEFNNNRALFEAKTRYFTKKYANPLGSKKVFNTDWDFTYNK